LRLAQGFWISTIHHSLQAYSTFIIVIAFNSYCRHHECISLPLEYFWLPSDSRHLFFPHSFPLLAPPEQRYLESMIVFPSVPCMNIPPRQFFLQWSDLFVHGRHMDKQGAYSVCTRTRYIFPQFLHTFDR